KFLIVGAVAGTAFLARGYSIDVSEPPSPAAGGDTPALLAAEVIHSGSDAGRSGGIEGGAFRARAFPGRGAVKTGETDPPALRAARALAADLETGEIYYAQETGRRWPLASLTKLMTASLARSAFAPGDAISLLEDDFPPDGVHETSVLRAGERYRAEDLITAMLLTSSNEAAEAFARAYGRDAFIAAMNSRAGEWGLHATHFADPTGLHAANQSTPEDILALAARIRRDDPDIFRITREENAVVRELGAGTEKILRNLNLFAGGSRFLGGKTGYTDEASGNLLSLFEYHGRPIGIVVLGTDDRFGETELFLYWFAENYAPR
ncbi:MAG: D-alanyl-D-alanine carboxypeptidase, partial [Candidatus Liptonbacteria bacterium]|nr:D-alanyl-D-alanine carboxypeptidase [Candidatus Liptonbacteria bacterium]